MVDRIYHGALQDPPSRTKLKPMDFAAYRPGGADGPPSYANIWRSAREGLGWHSDRRDFGAHVQTALGRRAHAEMLRLKRVVQGELRGAANLLSIHILNSAFLMWRFTAISSSSYDADQKVAERLQKLTFQLPRATARVLARVQDASQLTPFIARRAKESVVVVGDSNATLALLGDGLFQTCVTSPPYWSLRDYNISGQIGLEATLDDYLSSLVRVFEQVRRVLRDDGTLWLNIGDAYTSGNRTWRAPDRRNPTRAMRSRPPTPAGLKPKELVGVPWRLAFALQQAGWYLRSDLIWNKPNCQPESVKDRPTHSHEYLFMFSKNEHYYYDGKAVRGPNNRNLRTVWDIHTQSAFEGAHFATFPPALVEPCLALSTRRGDLVLDPFFGSGTTGHVALGMRRRFFGVELNPEYASIAERRLNGAVVRDRPAD